MVLRAEDVESRSVVAGMGSSWPALTAVFVDRAGVVAAMNAGLSQASGDILALTDDDAEPNADWLERIVATFDDDPGVGGVGGRDDQAQATGSLADVGRLQWIGRLVGNHHVGAGPARDVDVLKGVCCAFRLPLLRAVGFDERLRGAGAQVHWELSLCLAMRRSGWRLVYDPAISVRHHVGIRHDADQLHRGRFDVAPHEDAVFNETLVIAEHLAGLRRTAFVAWTVLVGTSDAPGLLQVPRLMFRGRASAMARWGATQRARRAGFHEAQRHRASGVVPMRLPSP